MPKLTTDEIEQLCERLEVDPPTLIVCLEESIIEIDEIDGQLGLQNGTILQLRRLQRICCVFEVDIHAALLLSERVHLEAR